MQDLKLLNNRKEYLKDNELQTNGKNKNSNDLHKGIN